MPEDLENGQQGETVVEEGGQNNGPAPVPYSRFTEVNTELNKWKSDYEKLKGKMDEQERKQLEDSEEYKKLYEKEKENVQTLSGVKSEFEKYKEKVTATNERILAQIPDERKHLVPPITDPIAMSEYLDKAAADLIGKATPLAPGLNGGSGLHDQNQPALTARQRELIAIAQNSGYEVDASVFTGQVQQQAPAAPDPGTQQIINQQQNNQVGNQAARNTVLGKFLGS